MFITDIQTIFFIQEKRVFAYGTVNNTTISPHACQRDDAMSKNYEY